AFKAPKVNDLYQYIEPGEVVFCSKRPVNWHARFGHPSEGKLKELQKLYPHLELSHPSHCETCIMAKQKQMPYKTTEERASAPLELIHTDICESKCVAYDGSRYFVLFMDDFSKYAEVYVLKSKASSVVIEAFKDFRARLEKQLESGDQHVIKKVRSDNGGE